MNRIQVQKKPIEISVIQDELRADNPAVGALVTFVGLMRDMNEGDCVATMTLEHYPGMTEKALEGIVREAQQRWDLLGVRVVHRVGELQPLDPIVVVAVASAHRGEAFRACEFLIDYLKSENKISFATDQMLHRVCKVIYAALLFANWPAWLTWSPG